MALVRVPAWMPALIAGLLSLGGCGPADTDSGASATSGLAILARGEPGFAEARPGVPLRFPRDHGAHPGFRIEWWYLTANLEDGDGQPYGAQWTLFRVATEPPGGDVAANPWRSGQVYMAHMAITAPGGHVAFQRYARGGDHAGVRQAGVTAQPFAAWLDDWRLQSTESAWLPLEVQARQGDYAMRLRLQSDRPPVLQGDRGFSAKNPNGTGSFYYSQPFLQADGELVVDGQVVPVTGLAWLDREWSSQFLQPDQAGWDWFSLHLDSGEKLMLFRLRSREPGGDFRHAALIDPSGETQVIEPPGLSLEVLATRPVAGRDLPMHWRIALPGEGRTFEVEALRDDQWLAVDFPYWEGAVVVRGKDGHSRGRGYMELTGY